MKRSNDTIEQKIENVSKKLAPTPPASVKKSLATPPNPPITQQFKPYSPIVSVPKSGKKALPASTPKAISKTPHFTTLLKKNPPAPIILAPKTLPPFNSIRPPTANNPKPTLVTSPPSHIQKSIPPSPTPKSIAPSPTPKSIAPSVQKTATSATPAIVKLEKIPEFQTKIKPTAELEKLIHKHTSPPSDFLLNGTGLPEQEMKSQSLAKPQAISQIKTESSAISAEQQKANLKPFRVEARKEVIPKSLLLADRYSPKKVADVIGNPKGLQELKQWLSDFKAKKPGTEPAVLLSGPPGIGKTSIAHVLFKENGYLVSEFNASEERTRAAIGNRLYPLMTNKSSTLIKCTGNAVVLDEIDGMTGDQGGMGVVVALLKGEFAKFKSEMEGNKKTSIGNISSFKVAPSAKIPPQTSGKKATPKSKLKPPPSSTPVICIANQSYSKKLSSLKSICKEIKFTAPTLLQQRELIERVLTGEGFTFGPMVSLCLAQKINTPDFRHILVELDQILRDHLRAHNDRHISDEQASQLNVGKVDHDSQSPFAAAIRLLKGGQNLEESFVTISVDAGLLPSMLAQNYTDFLPMPAKQNRTAKQIAQAEALTNQRLFEQAELYSQCDLFPSYSHHMQMIVGFGTSVLGGKPLPQNTIRQNPQTLAPLTFPDFAVHRAQQTLKHLPYSLRLSAPVLDMDLVRFRLPTAEYWGKDKAASQKVQDLLKWTEHYQLEFADVSNLNSLTQLGKNGTNPKSKPIVFGGKGKKGLQALMRIVKDNDLSEAELNAALEDSMDEDLSLDNPFPLI